jgi:hypothetical protein
MIGLGRMGIAAVLEASVSLSLRLRPKLLSRDI